MPSILKITVPVVLFVSISSSYATITETYPIPKNDSPKIDVSIKWKDGKGTSYQAKDNEVFDIDPKKNSITITFQEEAGGGSKLVEKTITPYDEFGFRKDPIKENFEGLSDNLPSTSFPTFTTNGHSLVTWVDFAQLPSSYAYTVGDEVSVLNGVVLGLPGVRLLVGDSLLELPADTPIDVFSDSITKSLPLFTGVAFVKSEVVTSMVPEPGSFLLVIAGLAIISRRFFGLRGKGDWQQMALVGGVTDRSNGANS